MLVHKRHTYSTIITIPAFILDPRVVFLSKFAHTHLYLFAAKIKDARRYIVPAQQSITTQVMIHCCNTNPLMITITFPEVKYTIGSEYTHLNKELVDYLY